ncbi:MAG TPA: carbohydrate-binding protein [Pyrinomonadaceae bacterium]
MSKKTKKRARAVVPAAPPRRRKKLPKLAAAAIIACALLTAIAAPRWDPFRRAVGLKPLAPSAAPQGGGGGPLQLAKEYIYAGGRLVATEEPAAQVPYGGSARPLPGVVQAEDFDEGGEGLAYHDTDPNDNVMNGYRPDPSGVDIEGCGDAGGGFNVGWTWATEWMEYTVSVASAGTYDIGVRVASGNGGGGTFHVEMDGANLTGALTVPNTGGWQTYQTVSVTGVSLTPGVHVMRLSLDTAGPQGGVANFNYISVTPGTSGSAPSNLLATAATTTQVDLTWTAPAGSIARYEVERSQSVAGGWSALNTQVTGTSFNDTTAAANTAYLYRVRAVFTNNSPSPYSNSDLATTVLFSDDPLTVGATPVKAAHFYELRTAVGAVRTNAGLSAASWTDATLAGVRIKAVHVEELRARIDEARTSLGLSASAYTDASLPGVSVKKVHVDELRQRVK